MRSRAEAAELLGVSEDTIDRLRQTKRLTWVQLPGTRRVGIPQSAIDALLQAAGLGLMVVRGFA